MHKNMIIKSNKYWLGIDQHRTQSPVRSNVFKLFLKVVYVWVWTCQHMFRNPLYDDALFARLELLQKHNFNIETIKNDLNLN